MKKLFALLLCFIFIGVVHAEKCTVVTGDGSHLGDEIQCGTEHFYIIKTNNDTTQLMAKYNLLVGDEINFEAIDESTFDFTPYEGMDNSQFCQVYTEGKGYHPYLAYPTYDFSTSEFTGCRVYEKISTEHIRQDEKAVGTKIINGKSVLPLYGITYMIPAWGYDAIHDNIVHTNNYDNNDDLIIDGSTIAEAVNGYKAELISQNINVVAIEMPTLTKIVDFVEAVSGRDFLLELNGNLVNPTNPEEPYFYTAKMDMREYLPENFSWLYDRTYWMGTGGEVEGYPVDYYISNEGYLCALGRGECLYLSYPIGNGVRPVVTINTEDINFKIETKTDGNGEVKAEKIQARGGEVIKFTVVPAEGYVLGEVKVIDALGNVVIFNDYTFTMPNANVTIEATFKKVNPATGDIIITLSAITFGFAIVICLINYKKIKGA